MKLLLSKAVLAFGDPYLEQLYNKDCSSVTNRMIRLNIALDLLVFLLMSVLTLYYWRQVSRETILLFSGIFLLHLLTLSALFDFRLKEPLAFLLLVLILLLNIILFMPLKKSVTIRSIYLYYVFNSGCATIKNMSNQYLILGYNVLAGILLFVFAHYYRLEVLDESVEYVVLFLVPLFMTGKVWGEKFSLKQNLANDLTCRKMFNLQSKILDNLPVGILVAEHSKVVYQTGKSKELLKSATPDHTLLSLNEIKVSSANIEFEKYKAEDGSSDSPQDALIDSESRRLPASFEESMKEIQNNLTFLTFLNMFLDVKPFRENYYAEISNAVFKSKSLDMFVVTSTYQDKPCAILVTIDSTVKSKRVFLEESNKYKSRVLGYISHSLKNPVHNIQNALSQLRSSIDAGENQKLEEQLQVANNNCQITFSLRSLLPKLIEEYSHTKRKIVQLTCNVHEKVPNRVLSSESIVRVIIKNLLTNSIKNTFSGYICVSVEPSESRQDTLKVSVKDTGKGISKSRLDAILKELNSPKDTFDCFSELSIGLGIKMCHQLAKIISPPKEKLEITSVQDQGTCCSFMVDISPRPPWDKEEKKVWKYFYLDDSKGQKVIYQEVHKNSKKSSQRESIPEMFDRDLHGHLSLLHRSSISTGLKQAQQDAPLSDSLTNIKVAADNKCTDCFDILIVDDDSNNLDWLEEHLTSTSDNWRVKKANDGQEAIKQLKAKCHFGHPLIKECKLVITDIEMPRMKGDELARQVRAFQKSGLFSSFSIIATTANISEFQTLNQKTKLFDGLLPKPYSREDILAIANSSLRIQAPN